MLVTDAVSLIMLTDKEIARMECTNVKRVGEAETERSYPISVGCRNHVKRVREHLIYLSGVGTSLVAIPTCSHWSVNMSGRLLFGQHGNSSVPPSGNSREVLR